jgi:hypothetical protein
MLLSGTPILNHQQSRGGLRARRKDRHQGAQSGEMLTSYARASLGVAIANRRSGAVLVVFLPISHVAIPAAAVAVAASSSANGTREPQVLGQARRAMWRRRFRGSR